MSSYQSQPAIFTRGESTQVVCQVKMGRRVDDADGMAPICRTLSVCVPVDQPRSSLAQERDFDTNIHQT
jgi:hypothetical protein